MRNKTATRIVTPEVVRVAIYTNFNCTPAEYQQLEEFVRKYPNRIFFTNSNSKTPKLLAINDYPYKAVITINPDITISQDQVNRTYQVNPSKVAFIRVKYLPENLSHVQLINDLHGRGYNVVITPMRFICKDTLTRYTKLEYYKWECSRYYINPEALHKLHALVDSYNPKTVYICDRKGLGCSDCKQCSTLITGQRLRISSLDLSTSGKCAYNCPDCYAKALQVRSKKIKFDTIKRNKKQIGQTVHIQRTRKQIAA